jgi:hypothetical protein
MNNRLPHRESWRGRSWVAVVLLLFAGPGVAWALTSPCKVAYIEGQVEVLRNGTTTPVPAEVGMSLFYGDQVTTRKGKCQLNLTATGILRLSPNTKVWLPTEENKDDKIGLWNMLAGKTAKNSRQVLGFEVDEVFEVRAPTLVAGVSDLSPAADDSHPNHGQALEEWRQGRRQEIERLRAEANAKLAAIRAELAQKEGKPVTHRCSACGSNGPHRWTTDGWECNCGATALRFSDYSTSQGAYNQVKDSYRSRIEEIEQKIR